MICPYCGVGVKFDLHTFDLQVATTALQAIEAHQLATAKCPECSGYVVVFQQGHGEYRDYSDYEGYTLTVFEFAKFTKESVVYPHSQTKPLPLEVPESYKVEFPEACGVLPISPKASAALSRRLLQRVLREEFQIPPSDLSREIDVFIQTKGASSTLNDEIDAIRNIGNFAAHPMKSSSTGEIVDVEPGEAEWLIDVIEDLFDFAFVQPKKLQERRHRLNKKLQDLGKPPMKQV
jgi:hypothetical protein